MLTCGFSFFKVRGAVGRAGDPIPKFTNHMIRCRVDRTGQLFPLPPASELRCCTMPRDQIGMPKEAALKGWFEYRAQYDIKWASLRKKSGLISDAFIIAKAGS